MAKMLKMGFLFRIMTDITSQTNLSRNFGLDFGVVLKIDHVDDAKDAPVESWIGS